MATREEIMQWYADGDDAKRQFLFEIELEQRIALSAQLQRVREILAAQYKAHVDPQPLPPEAVAVTPDVGWSNDEFFQWLCGHNCPASVSDDGLVRFHLELHCVDVEFLARRDDTGRYHYVGPVSAPDTGATT